MAARVAHDIPEGAYVNLGIGLPTLVANHLPADREIFLHSENGLLGMGPAPAPGEEDDDLINAGKQPVTLLPGGAYFHHADSFAMMRGGHLDICVLGAFQVSATGDLANWHTGAPDAIPAVGGAMDLAIGAKQVYVMMEHLTKRARARSSQRCSYPLTGIGCVARIYTDLAVIDVTPRRPASCVEHRRRPVVRRTAAPDAACRCIAPLPKPPDELDRTSETRMTRSLHLRRHPHARSAATAARSRSVRADDLGARADQGADGAQPERRLGRRRRRDLRLRQPGRRGQPQRRAHVGAARRPADRACRARPSTACAARAWTRSARRRARSSAARPS